MPKSILSTLVLSAVVALTVSATAFAADAAPGTKAADVTLPKKGRPLPEPANPGLPSVILIGDSTVRNGQDDGQGKGPEGQWGWGHVIAEYFDPAKVNVVNRAVGGLSSRTYYTGFWETTLSFVKPGDLVIMQLGHNDNIALNDAVRARGTIKGTGEETQEIDNLLTKKHEVVHTYGWYLRKMIADAKAKGATPIVCSLVPRKSWGKDGKVGYNQDYAKWAQEVAQQEKVPFIPLNRLVVDRYNEVGHDAVMKLFPQVTPDEHTHTNWAGADLNAQMVIAGLKALKPNPVAGFLSPKGEAVPAAK